MHYARSRNRVGLLLGILLLLACLTADAQDGANEIRLDQRTVQQAAGTLQQEIRDAVDGAGGDIEHQHLHLVVGLSTGNFGRDSTAMQAARDVAGIVAQQLLIPGDELSGYAWEMHLWSHLPPGAANPVIISARVDRKKLMLEQLPSTPQHDTQGGHDTEQALVEIAGAVQQPSETVIVLLTNTAASASDSDAPLIGTDHPDYQAFRDYWRLLPAVDRSGASLKLPYTVIKASGERVNRTLDVIIAVPPHYTGAAISEHTRSWYLQHPARSGVNWLYYLFGGLLLIGIAVGAVKIIQSGVRPATGILSIGGQRFTLEGHNDGDEICHLAGPGYPEARATTVEVGHEEGAPPGRLLRFLKGRGGVTVQDDQFRLQSVNGVMTTAPWLLRPGGRHKLEIAGNIIDDPALPARRVTLIIEVQLDRISNMEGGGNP